MRIMTYRRANNLIFAAIILINGYVIAAPLVPNVWYWWQTRNSFQMQQLSEKISAPTKSTATSDAKPLANELIIPKMLLDTPIVEGPKQDSYSMLNKGAWRLPFTSTPDMGGNTVIAGHRFSYTGPRGIFYYLNKLAVGDEIGIRWNGVVYNYTVQSVSVVPPTEVSVQGKTTDTRLTLYTCTPLWNPVNRLVVVAVPKENT